MEPIRCQKAATHGSSISPSTHQLTERSRPSIPYLEREAREIQIFWTRSRSRSRTTSIFSPPPTSRSRASHHLLDPDPDPPPPPTAGPLHRHTNTRKHQHQNVGGRGLATRRRRRRSLSAAATSSSHTNTWKHLRRHHLLPQLRALLLQLTRQFDHAHISLAWRERYRRPASMPRCGGGGDALTAGPSLVTLHKRDLHAEAVARAGPGDEAAAAIRESVPSHQTGMANLQEAGPLVCC